MSRLHHDGSMCICLQQRWHCGRAPIGNGGVHPFAATLSTAYQSADGRSQHSADLCACVVTVVVVNVVLIVLIVLCCMQWVGVSKAGLIASYSADDLVIYVYR